jgi:cytochrome c oxidase subunit III
MASRAPSHAPAEHDPLLAHHFDSMVQQRTAVELGIWVFLAQEVMFFGGLFLAYTFYRTRYHDAFVEASHHLDVRLGAFNTVVLITSSLTMALAVRAAQRGDTRAVRNWVVATMLLGGAFLGVKAYEYNEKFVDHLVPGIDFAYHGEHPRGAQIFYLLYFVMTGMHALHMIIGFGIMIALLVWNARGRVSASYPSRVEAVGLYWHFVDIVWIFLFPLLYLISRH